MTETEQRAALVRECRSWIGTPYHLGARIKGVGVDCATFISEVLIACGFAAREDLGIYSHDWYAHVTKERYLRGLLQHASQTIETVAYRSIEAHPGDIVLTRTPRSKVYNHGAIVVAWPKAVHAVAPAVEEIDAAVHPMWSHRGVAIFSVFAAAKSA